MLNVKTLTDTMSRMELPQLQQYASLHKNDPYIVTLALSIANQKKQMKAGQAGQAGMMPQPKVADQQIAQMSAPSPQQMAPQQHMLPEDQGIGTLPAQNMQNFAGGGITGQGGLQLNIPLDLGGDGGGYRGMGSTTANFPQSNGGFTGNNNAPQVTSNPSLVADQAQRLAQQASPLSGLGAPQGPLLAGGSMGQFSYAAGGPRPEGFEFQGTSAFGGNPQQSMSQLMGLLGGKSMAGGGIVAFDEGGSTSPVGRFFRGLTEQTPEQTRQAYVRNALMRKKNSADRTRRFFGLEAANTSAKGNIRPHKSGNRLFRKPCS